MAETARGVSHQQWERAVGHALADCDTKQLHIAGIMMLRQMIELDGYTPEEAWNHFCSLCEFHLSDEVMTRARNRVAERYGYPIPKGTYDDTNTTRSSSGGGTAADFGNRA